MFGRWRVNCFRLAEHASNSVSSDVAASLAYCKRVAKARAGNFYHGMKLTPEPKRSAIYAVYAFMRACDDLADEAGPGEDVAVRREGIEAFRTRMDEAVKVARGGGGIAGNGSNVLVPDEGGDVWPAFTHVMREYPIDPADLHHMLDGQLADLSVHRYETFDELYGYCYNVASTVGLVCVAVWGWRDEVDGDEVRRLAEKRGIALQLTNMLRDIREDAGMGRVYLPGEDFERFGVKVSDVAAGHGDAAFDRFMAFQIERARSFYSESAGLDEMIEPRCRATSWAIMKIYEMLLDRIAADPRAVLSGRVRLRFARKVGVGLRALIR